jgi:hypothetical protein
MYDVVKPATSYRKIYSASEELVELAHQVGGVLQLNEPTVLNVGGARRRAHQEPVLWMEVAQYGTKARVDGPSSAQGLSLLSSPTPA